jgi:hypothetical protein
MEKKVPATQAEQVADDVAPATVEYVPAKASHEEYGLVDSIGELTQGEGETVGGENTFDS